MKKKIIIIAAVITAIIIVFLIIGYVVPFFHFATLSCDKLNIAFSWTFLTNNGLSDIEGDMYRDVISYILEAKCR